MGVFSINSVNCNSCGNTLFPNSKFCDNCGSSVKQVNSTDVPVKQVKPTTNVATPQPYRNFQSNHNTEPRKLYRSRGNRMIAGVCGGIGEHYNIDANIIRLLWLIGIFTGIGIIAYLVAIMIIPESPYDPWKEPKRSD